MRLSPTRLLLAGRTAEMLITAGAALIAAAFIHMITGTWWGLMVFLFLVQAAPGHEATW